MNESDTPAKVGSSEGLGLAPERGLLARLQSLKVLLGTDAPEVRGWAPVVQREAQATVNATIAALKDMNAMSARLEQTMEKLADDNERLREALRRVHEWGSLSDGYSYTVANDVKVWFKAGACGELPSLPAYAKRPNARVSG